MVLITIVTVVEFGIVVYNFLLFQNISIQSIWWFVTGIPLYQSSISKIWYVTLVANVQQKFAAINDHLESTANFFEEVKKRQVSNKSDKLVDSTVKGKEYSVGLASGDGDSIGGYLHREINAKMFRRGQHMVAPGEPTKTPSSTGGSGGVRQVLPMGTQLISNGIIYVLNYIFLLLRYNICGIHRRKRPSRNRANFQSN